MRRPLPPRLLPFLLLCLCAAAQGEEAPQSIEITERKLPVQTLLDRKRAVQV